MNNTAKNRMSVLNTPASPIYERSLSGGLRYKPDYAQGDQLTSARRDSCILRLNNAAGSILMMLPALCRKQRARFRKTRNASQRNYERWKSRVRFFPRRLLSRVRGAAQSIESQFHSPGIPARPQRI